MAENFTPFLIGRLAESIREFISEEEPLGEIEFFLLNRLVYKLGQSFQHSLGNQFDMAEFQKACFPVDLGENKAD